MKPTASYLYGIRQFTTWALLDFVKLICSQRFYYPGSVGSQTSLGVFQAISILCPILTNLQNSKCIRRLF
ncbi:MAG: hypothetical protein P8P49_07395 [Opitutales bacterium]|nr:hypothetical protein [Opitutales bacterium]